MRRLFASLLAILLAAAEAFAAGPQVSTGRGGAVAAAEATSAGVGIEILKKGGNAADATVAVAFALAVTWPEAGNLGGGGFWVSRDARGRVLVVDFREMAPRNARRDLYIRKDKNGIVPSSTEGPLSSGVPGTVAGLSLAHRRAGHLPWQAVVAPAVRLAHNGFAVTEVLARSIAKEKDRLAKDSETARIFLPNGQAPAVGSILKQPDLARTLEDIRDRRDDGFYRGRVAREIEAGQERDGGLISRGDLARYAARLRAPVQFKFQGAEIVTPPAPSGGPVLAEIAMLAQYVGLEKLKTRDAPSAHLLAEIEKRAFRDRNQSWRPLFPRVRRNLTDPALKTMRRPSTRSARPRLGAARAGARALDDAFLRGGRRGRRGLGPATLNDSSATRIAPGLRFLWNNGMDDCGRLANQHYGQSGRPARSRPASACCRRCPAIAVVGGRNAFVWGRRAADDPDDEFQVLLGSCCAARRSRTRSRRRAFISRITRTRSARAKPFDPAWIAALQKLGHTVAEREPDDPIGRVHAIAPARRLAHRGHGPRSGGVGLVAGNPVTASSSPVESLFRPLYREGDLQLDQRPCRG
jgi:gamma-glutamyltranspeptidase